MGCISSKEERFTSKLGPADERNVQRLRSFRRKATCHPIPRGASNRNPFGDDDFAADNDNFANDGMSRDRPTSRRKPRPGVKSQGEDEEQKPEEVVEVESLVVDTEVMRRAGMFEAMDAAAKEPKSPLKVQVKLGKRSSRILESFEEKERLAHTLPEKVEVEKKVGDDVGAKLRDFESAEAEARAEPRLEKSYTQRLSEKGEELTVLQLAKAV